MEIAKRLEVAGSLFARLFGLAGRRSLESCAGLLLPNTNGIHTFGMRFPIDVLVLDREGRVLRADPAVKPWRILWPIRGGRQTLELATGTISRFNVRSGDLIQIVATGAHDS